MASFDYTKDLFKYSVNPASVANQTGLVINTTVEGQTLTKTSPGYPSEDVRYIKLTLKRGVINWYYDNVLNPNEIAIDIRAEIWGWDSSYRRWTNLGKSVETSEYNPSRTYTYTPTAFDVKNFSMFQVVYNITKISPSSYVSTDGNFSKYRIVDDLSMGTAYINTGTLPVLYNKTELESILFDTKDVGSLTYNGTKIY